MWKNSGAAFALLLMWGACAHVVPERAREANVGGRPTGITRAELQQSLQRLTGTMSQRLAQASEPFHTSDDPRVTEQALRRTLLYNASALDIASGPKPEVNLLDMLVFASLTRQAFQNYWMPEVFGPEGEPMLRALAGSEAEVWGLADNLLSAEQRADVREYIREWQASHPDQVQVEAVRLSEFAKQAGKSAQARKTRGLLRSVQLAAKTGDDAVLLGERALFLGQRVPFLLRSQARLGAMEVLGDSLGQIERVETLLNRSEALLGQVNELKPTLAEASALTERTERALSEARELVTSIQPVLQTLTPLLQKRGELTSEEITRAEWLAENSRRISDNAVVAVRELRELAAIGGAPWDEAQRRLDGSVLRWLAGLAVVGVIRIVTLCAGYVTVKRALARRGPP
ncbi:MAG: hypothetical protein QM778_10340 [Myxococcales bacterium]